MKSNKIFSFVLGLTAAATAAVAQDADSLKTAGYLLELSGDRNTSSVATVSGDRLYRSSTPNLTNTFSGNLPGLSVVRGDGTPGYGTARMRVRGIGSYAQATNVNTVKFYVDGFEVKSEYIQYLSPEEIESVSVLKDASALTALGMNGANGALWIETKRGSVGKPVITFQTRTGVQNPINVNKPLGAYEYAYYYNQAISNDNGMIWEPRYDENQLLDYWNGNATDVNWYDEVYRRNGFYTDGSLSFRGGSDAVRYSVVLDYANQQGLFNTTKTDKTSNVSLAKYGVRTNLDMVLNKVLTVSLDLGGRLEDRFRPNYDLYQLTQDVQNYPSNIYPVYDPKSTDPISNLSGTTTYPNNPVGSLTGLGWATSRTKTLQANFKFKENLGFLLKGLYLEEGFSFYAKTIGNTGKSRTYARYFDGVAQTADQSTYIRSNSYWSSANDRWMQGYAKAGYSNVFDGVHAIDAVISANISDYNATASAFYNWKYRYVNFSGKANYTFDSRYAAEVSYSYFGSDAYGPGHRFVLYPSLSLAWIASNESFLKDNGFVDYLKIRGSVGYAGSTEADVTIDGFETDGRYLYQQYYGTGGGFVTGFGPSFSWGDESLVPLFKANPDVTAEKSLKINAGIDATLGGKVSLTADWFLDKRTGILTRDNTLMSYYGNNLYYSNIGKMTNTGLDANFVYADKAGDFNWSVFGNVLYAVNTVDFMGEVPPKYAYSAVTGRPLGTRMGLECIGFYDVNDFGLDGVTLIDGLPKPLFGSVQPGDLKYKDQDGDGFIDDTDIVEIGAPAYPKATFALGADLGFKGFDFSFLFTGSAGSTVNLMDYRQWRPFLDYGNAFEWVKGAWAFYPEANIDTRATATFPRLTTVQNDNNYRSSSFWIKNNNYLRLQNVELGYDFVTSKAVRNAGLSKCRLYVNALNILTLSELLSKYNMDPETMDYAYPAVKSVNIGVQLSF